MTANRLQKLDAALSGLPARTESNGAAGGAIQRCALSWVAIQLYDEDGRPIAGVDYELRIGGEVVRSGRLDSNGYAIERNLQARPGSLCFVVFPGLLCSMAPLQVQS
jgi:hypothetical protein